MCDIGCTAIFDNTDITIVHKRKPILKGIRTPDGLWKIQLPMLSPTVTTTPTAINKFQTNFTVHNATTKHIIKCLHLSLFSPTKSTLLKALNNNHFIGWPALTHTNVSRHLGLDLPTILGHMDQQRQETRSTKNTSPTDHNITTDNDSKSDKDAHIKTHSAYMSLQELPTGRIFNQTGSFPTVSSQGMKAVMILYDFDSNAILVKGITSKSQIELTRAYSVFLKRLTVGGMQPKIQRMDNETSHTVKDFLINQNIALTSFPLQTPSP